VIEVDTSNTLATTPAASKSYNSMSSKVFRESDEVNLSKLRYSDSFREIP
jgi:hypothetical protein